MDFFEAQARARRRTNRLVGLFVAAVVGTILASYSVAAVLLGQTRHGYDDYAPTPWFRWDPQLFFGVCAAVLIVVGLGSLFKWSQLRSGGSAVAEGVGGRRVSPNTTDLNERRLLNVVEEMAIASGVPVPAVYVLDEEEGINAFAAGLSTSDAVVAVTRGTLEKLNRDELQGVIAHEFSHILNGDMRLNVKLTAIVFGILVLGLIGRGLLRSLGRGRLRSGKNQGGGIALLLALGLALLIIGYFGYFFGRLIQAAVSRQREFLADASAVQFTRNPLGISGALKKIGGYALGSALVDNRAGEISHFFFAQAFRSSFGGLWATHPPLGERLRAIDPRWDGAMFDPPQKVDVATETFASGAGFALGALRREVVREGATTPPRLPFAPSNVTAQIGTLTEQHFARAQSLLAALPDPLRDATRGPDSAVALVYSLLLAPDSSSVCAKQIGAITQQSGEATAQTTTQLRDAVRELAPELRLPLIQLCLPTLRALDSHALSRFLTTLDELVHADAQVSVFEFALQKVLLRHLDQLRRPQQRVDIYSFQAVAPDIVVALSALARADGQTDGSIAARAFAAGAAQLRLLENLALASAADCSLERLDTALDRLAVSSFPIRQRVLVAAAHVIGCDGTVTVEEGELYRAIAAALDCPMPALGEAS